MGGDRNVDGIAGDCGRIGDARMRVHVCGDAPKYFAISRGHCIDTPLARAKVQKHLTLAVDRRCVMNDCGPDVIIELAHIPLATCTRSRAIKAPSCVPMNTVCDERHGMVIAFLCQG